MKLVTLGPKGTFSHQAICKMHKNPNIVFADNIDAVFFRLGEKDIRQGLVPIKNSYSGFVENTVINLMKYDFSICGKTEQKIIHYLAGMGKIENANKLYAHPHAYKQCKKTLSAMGIDCEIFETLSNSHSALQLKLDQKSESIAIVSPLAAEIYQLPILKKNIEDIESTTTFLLIGKELCKSTGKDCSSFLLFSDHMKTVENQIQTLVKEKKSEVLKLENLLLQEGLTSLYFMELTGHVLDEKMQEILEILHRKFLLKHLGSYPK